MLPILQQEFVDKHKWVTEKEMLDIIVLSESLPGAVAIDAVVMLGYRVEGVIGGVVAAFAVVLPSFIVLTMVTMLYSAIDEHSKIWLFIKGVRAGIIGMMIAVLAKLFKNAVSDWFTSLMFVMAFILAMFTNLHLIIIVITGGIIGLLYRRLTKA